MSFFSIIRFAKHAIRSVSGAHAHNNCSQIYILQLEDREGPGLLVSVIIGDRRTDEISVVQRQEEECQSEAEENDDSKFRTAPDGHGCQAATSPPWLDAPVPLTASPRM